MSDLLQSQLHAFETTTAETVPIADVRAFIAQMKQTLGWNGQPEGEMSLFRQLGELAKFINEAKKSLQDANAGTELPDASSHLDAIIKMTETATTQIMDQCERVQSTHATIRDRLLDMDPPLDPDAMASVEDSLQDAETSVTHIYEACNFQDITGQRIMKVVKMLQEIERMVLKMIVLFGLEHSAGLDDATRSELAKDVELLSGPALPGQGLEQDDIDDILRALVDVK